MKVSEAIEKVALNLSLIDGQNMSPYSDDQIANYLSNAHEMITTEYTWPEMTATFIKTLDGSTGRVTEAFKASDGFTDYKQLAHVYCSLVQRELPLTPPIVNPLLQSSLISYRPLSDKEDPDKEYMIQIAPVTLAAQVALVVNLKADLSDPETTVPIDALAHIWLASWMFAVDDGTNPGQADKYLKLYNNRMMMLRANVNSGPMAMNPFNGPSQQWWPIDGY